MNISFDEIKIYIIILTSFGIILISSNQISKFFQKIKLPLITGMLIVGMIIGPHIIDLMHVEELKKLSFINDISLAFIAFAAGAELYLKELRGNIKNIKWMTFGQLVVTFVLSSLIIFFISEYIPFMQGLNKNSRIAISLLSATIFVARSPASAIAVINELRAKGPFTKTAMGVTIIKDVLVIILFTICFMVADNLIYSANFNIVSLIKLLVSLLLSFGFGILAGKIMILILKFNFRTRNKAIIIVLFGWSIFVFANYFKHFTYEYFTEIHLEPLLIGISGSFIVTNYSKYRIEFLRIIEKAGPYIYVAFFTLTGATLSLDIIVKSWFIAIIFFLIRLLTMIIGSFVGGSLSGDSWKISRIAWMPYVTQAGVSLGLITIISGHFTGWTEELSTILISVIVINQFIGPPLFKWAIIKVNEAHTKAKTSDFDGIKDAVIFGLEGEAIALSQMLERHNWETKIVSRKIEYLDDKYKNTKIEIVEDFSFKTLKKLNLKNADAVVLMKSDKENYLLCELIYEKFGIKNVIVKLNNRDYFSKFHELGALIVEPATAMVGLLDHFVRSPNAVSLILGTDENSDTIDIEVLNPDIHGIALRDLKLPFDILILSIKRAGQLVISHGYTRLRIGDIVTVVGSVESLEKIRLNFEYHRYVRNNS